MNSNNQSKRKNPTSSKPVKKTTKSAPKKKIKVEKPTHEDEPTVPTPEELIVEELERKKSEEGEDSSSPHSASSGSSDEDKRFDQLIEQKEAKIVKLEEVIEDCEKELETLKGDADELKFRRILDAKNKKKIKLLEKVNALHKKQAESQKLEMKRRKLKTLEALVAKNWPGTKINFRIATTGSKHVHA